MNRRFACGELKFSGHVVGSEGVRPDLVKTSAAAEFPRLMERKIVRRFLGICTYHRRFIRDFAKLSALLTYLTKYALKFEWTEEQQRALYGLKQRPQTLPILGHFDQFALTEIQKDSSNTGLGAVPAQLQDGTETIIA